MSSPANIKTGHSRSIYLHVENGDALAFKADVLALKYAQASYGADRAAIRALSVGLPQVGDELPACGDFRLVNTLGQIGAARVLFVGTRPLSEFRYGEIREFSRAVLEILSKNTPDALSLAITVNGPSFGLDEIECFKSTLAGLLDALISGDFPPTLTDVAILETVDGRASRFNQELDRLMKSRVLEIDRLGLLQVQFESATVERLRSVGRASEEKPMLFVAMPFREDMRDHYDYGIFNAAQKAGFLCERADYSHFTGDVFQWVKSRIDACKAVVADLSYANPNVYLEVGYAWGRNKRTILLLRDGDRATFDVQGQRYLTYKRIKDIEELLHLELVNL